MTYSINIPIICATITILANFITFVFSALLYRQLRARDMKDTLQYQAKVHQNEVLQYRCDSLTAQVNDALRLVERYETAFEQIAYTIAECEREFANTKYSITPPFDVTKNDAQKVIDRIRNAVS